MDGFPAPQTEIKPSQNLIDLSDLIGTDKGFHLSCRGVTLRFSSDE